MLRMRLCGSSKERQPINLAAAGIKMTSALVLTVCLGKGQTSMSNTNSILFD